MSFQEFWKKIYQEKLKKKSPIIQVTKEMPKVVDNPKIILDIKDKK